METLVLSQVSKTGEKKRLLDLVPGAGMWGLRGVGGWAVGSQASCEVAAWSHPCWIPPDSQLIETS